VKNTDRLKLVNREYPSKPSKSHHLYHPHYINIRVRNSCFVSRLSKQISCWGEFQFTYEPI